MATVIANWGSEIQDSHGMFEGTIALISRLISLAQQPLDVALQFSKAQALVCGLPLSETQRTTAVRRLKTAQRFQEYQEFGAARHELNLVHHSLVKSQKQDIVDV